MKTRWTPSRIIYALLSTIFILILVFGVYILLSGTGSVQSANTKNTPEDWSGVFGLVAGFLGFGLIIVAGVLSLLLGGLYLHATRRLKHDALLTNS